MNKNLMKVEIINLQKFEVQESVRVCCRKTWVMIERHCPKHFIILMKSIESPLRNNLMKTVFLSRREEQTNMPPRLITFQEAAQRNENESHESKEHIIYKKRAILRLFYMETKIVEKRNLRLLKNKSKYHERRKPIPHDKRSMREETWTYCELWVSAAFHRKIKDSEETHWKKNFGSRRNPWGEKNKYICKQS